MNFGYTKAFFNNIDGGSSSSANTILRIIGQYIQPRSVVDIGCGTSAWIKAATDIFSIDPASALGVDGEYTRPLHENLPYRFLYRNLADVVQISNSFELAMSLEMAEHLPLTRASSFVDELCRMSTVGLFSAASPGQGGTGHVNEQSADYWRHEFARNGFEMFDPVRHLVWQDAGVAPWYAQNCFLYVHTSQADVAKRLAAFRLEVDDWRLRLIHPGIFRLAACESAGAGRILRALPGRLVAALKSRFPSVFPRS